MTEEMEPRRIRFHGRGSRAAHNAYKVSEGARHGPERIRDTPISEAASGSASVPLRGLRPIVEFMSWSFAGCFDQLYNNAANVRYMSGGQFKVPIVFRGGNGIAHQLGATHSHRVDAYAESRLIVIAPSPLRCQGAAETAIRCDDPVMFLESEVMLADKGEVPDGNTPPHRRGDTRKRATTDRLLEQVRKTSSSHGIGQGGIDAEIIDVRTLRPLDEQTIINSVKKTNRL
jgi:pyruvate dehydrogenase E1 component beta subunit